MSLLTDDQWEEYLLMKELLKGLLDRKEERSRIIIKKILNKNKSLSNKNKNIMIKASKNEYHKHFIPNLKSNNEYNSIEDAEEKLLSDYRSKGHDKKARIILALQMEPILTPDQFKMLPPMLQKDYTKIDKSGIMRNFQGDRVYITNIKYERVHRGSGGRRSMKNKKRTRKLRR